MKKLLLLGNLGWLLVLTLAITKCNSDKPGATPTLTSCNDVTGVTGMTPDFFLQGLARYRELQLSADNAKIRPLTTPDFEDARSCWYSIDTLKKFMCLIEKYAALDPKYDPANSDLGIRFYYATYPTTEQQPFLLKLGANVPPSVKQINVGFHHTLFMVPTHHDKESDINLDVFQPIQVRGSEIIMPDKKVNAATLYTPDWESYMKSGAATKLLILGKTSESTPSSKNQGSVCPPVCAGTAAATTGSADNLYPAGSPALYK